MVLIKKFFYALVLVTLFLILKPVSGLDLNDGLILNLPFENSARDNVTGNLPSINNATYQGTGCFSDGCYEFHDQIMKFTGSPDYDINNNSLTVCGWSNKTSSNNAAILSRGLLTGAGTNDTFKLYQGSVSHFDVREMSEELQTVPSYQVMLNRWDYVCGRWRGADQNITYWINGTIRSTSTQLDPSNASVNLDMSRVENYLIIGGYNASSAPSDHMYLDGRLDEITLYNRSLSDVEMIELFIRGGKPNGTPANFTIFVHDNSTGQPLFNWTATIYDLEFDSSPSSNKSIRMLNRTAQVTLSKDGYDIRGVTWDMQSDLYTWLTPGGGGPAPDNRSFCDLGFLPINYYPFDADANDYSGSNNGTLSGPTLNTSGQRFGDACYYFDGINDHISFANDLNDATNSFTVSGWIYGISGGSHGAMVSLGYTSQYGYLYYANSGTTVQSQLYDGSEYNPNWNYGSSPTGGYYHWVFTYDNNTKVGTTYLNGSVMNNVTRTNGFNTASMAEIFYVGGYKGTPSSTFWDEYKGYIDEILIYDRALTASEVRTLTEGCNPIGVNTAPNVSITSPLNGSLITVPENITFSITDVDNDSLVGNLSLYNGSVLYQVLANLTDADTYFYLTENITAGSYNLVLKMCETGTTELYCVNDSIEIIFTVNETRDICNFGYNPLNYYPLDDSADDYAGSNDGNVTGATLNYTGQKWGIAAYYFDGTSDELTFKNDLNNVNQDFSVSGWVYGLNGSTPEGSTNGAMISLGYTSAFGYLLYVNSNISLVQSQLYEGALFEPNYQDTNGASASWEHWAFSYEASSKVSTTYKNGVAVNNITRENNFNTVGMADFMRIGSYLPEGPPTGVLWARFSGLIDDVVVYNQSLTASYVRDLYSGCQPLSTNISAPVNNPPVVSITAPSNGSSVIVPINITFSIFDNNSDSLAGNLSLYNGSVLYQVLANLTDADTYFYLTENITLGTYDMFLEMCETNTTELYCSNDSIEIIFTVEEPPVQPVGNLTCYFNYEPYYFVKSFEALCFAENATNMSCYGYLVFENQTVQHVPEQQVLANNEVFNRFEGDSGVAIIEFSRENLRHEGELELNIVCYADGEKRNFMIPVTPELRDFIQVEDKLLWAKGNAGLLVGTFLILLGVFLLITFIIWVARK